MKILIAAAELATERETFTTEELVVRAWQRFPEAFGLAGYRELYPDSNRVLAKLHGAVGVHRRGWLDLVSAKTYRLSESGFKRALAARKLIVMPPGALT